MMQVLEWKTSQVATENAKITKIFLISPILFHFRQVLDRLRGLEYQT